MALFDNPTHTVTLSSLTTGTDTGGGVSNTYATAQSSVPCVINTASSSTRELFAQQEILVTHTVAFLASALTTVPTPGWKLTTDDRSESFRVHGIRYGRAYGTIPAFVYLECESYAGS
jgi:hypothetical protein